MMNMMKTIKLLLLCCLLGAFSACVKTGLEDFEDKKENPEEKTDDADDNTNDEGDGDYLYSVAQFMALDITGMKVGVVGYIVGDCTKNIKNAEWEKPFSYDTAILLADEPGETDYHKVISIQLKAGEMRELFSLHRNPELFGKKAFFYGSRKKYLGIPGMKDDIEGYELVDESEDGS